MSSVRHFIYQSPGGTVHDVHLSDDQSIPRKGQIMVIKSESGRRVRVTSVVEGDQPDHYLGTVEAVHQGR